MTNWPNIQEYRNFEAKFVDNSKRIDSPAESESETVIKDECKTKHESEDFINVPKLQNSESKTVRCVIRKEFEEAFKKLDRGDGFIVSHEPVRQKIQETPPAGQTAVDKIRLQNHLKWKKQKEEEYLLKKEAERLAQQKKREEELRVERIKKQREKEREEKMREWQEQKAREKEEKKREKMVMKELEDELKGVTPTVDKEKLIEAWVKLKNKQKQIEAEKKAEILKKEEESRALRQNLAEISYRQWKERIKGRMMTLPKNGYQIFGPKPAPVVKEDWNHDFTSGSPRNRSSIGLRGTRSNTSTSLSFRPPTKELEDLSKDIFYIGDNLLKSKNPSFCHLKTVKSGFNLYEGGYTPHKAVPEMPLKELQPATIDLKKTWAKDMKFDYNGFIPQDPSRKSKLNLKTISKHLEDYSPDFPSIEGDQNRCLAAQNKKLSGLLNAFPEPQVLPNKKKIDLYINTSPENLEENFPVKQQKKQPVKKTEAKPPKEEKKIEENHRREMPKKSFASLRRETKSVDKSLDATGKKPTVTEGPKEISRRSRSYDKPVKKFSKDSHKPKGCSSSRSMVKVSRAQEDTCSPPRLAKSKTSCQKRKSRKQSKPTTPEPPKTEKPPESESKTRKKGKKKNILSKSFSFIDSPYCVKSSKSLNKVKVARRKSAKDGETKSDGPGHCRKLSTTKI